MESKHVLVLLLLVVFVTQDYRIFISDLKEKALRNCILYMKRRVILFRDVKKKAQKFKAFTLSYR